MKIAYRYISSTIIKEFKTFHEMQNFAKDENHNGRYHIVSPLRHVSFSREQIIHFADDPDIENYIKRDDELRRVGVL